MHTSLLLSGGIPVLVCTPYASQGYPGSLVKLHPGGPTLKHQWEAGYHHEKTAHRTEDHTPMT